MVDSRTLLMIFDTAFLLAMAAWLGATLFFTFVISPTLFKVLEPSQAARFVRALFPCYYGWGATSTTIALASLTSGVLVRPEYRGPWALAQILLLLGGVLINLYCGNALSPRIREARDAGPDDSGRFDRLHRRSVWLNGVMILLGVMMLGAHAVRPDPRGPGVSEPTPAERARRGAERWQARSSDWDRENAPAEGAGSGRGR